MRKSLIIILFCTVTAAAWPVMQSTWTGGELSPLAYARLDAQRYYQSAQTIENLIPLPQGPLVRRPGTRFVAATDSNHVARLIPFAYATDDTYVLEFTDSLMRVYRDHGLVLNDDDSICHLITPFDANEIATLQVWQTADVMYLVDGTDWPQKLTRSGHNVWTIEDAPIDDGPFLTENVTTTTIAASAASGTVTLTASTPLFESGHVGGYWQLRNLGEAVQIDGTWDGPDDIGAVGGYTVQTGQNFQWSLKGTWVGTAELQYSTDAGSTWSAYTLFTSSGASETTETVFSNDTGADMLIRIALTAYTSGRVDYTLSRHAYMHSGVVHLTAVADPCHATGTVVRALPGTAATVRWSEGAWSTKRGFPRAICGYNDRLVLAGTTHQPVNLWASVVGEPDSFAAGFGDDADSFTYRMLRAQQDPILWLLAQRRRGLLAGTRAGLFELAPADETLGLTPSNPPMIVNTLGIPASTIPPVVADNICLITQAGGRKVREVLYSADAEALVAPDLTLFAEHITGDGLIDLAWTDLPYSLAWGVRSDGQLATLTYDRNYQLVGWARQVLGGDGAVEDLCVIPSAGDDEVWMTVRRTIDGQTVRYVEYLSPWDVGTDVQDQYFVDCGLSTTGPTVSTFSGLDHLEGQVVAILADGGPLTGTVSGGAVTIDYPAGTVHIGLPYTSTLKTVRFDLQTEQGVTWNRRKTLNAATVSFYRTLGARFGADASHLVEPVWSDGLMMAGVPDLFTGDTVKTTLQNTWGTDRADLLVIQSQPWPMTIRALVVDLEVR